MNGRAWSGRVFIGVSLDGKIARRDGDIGWLTDQPVGRDHVQGHDGPDAPPGHDDFMAATDHIVMGRGTYEKILTFGEWPYGKFTVIVLTSSPALESCDRITVARNLDDVQELLDKGGARGVYLDGGQVIQSFLRAGLVDEMTIGVAPVLIGDGIPLFGAVPHDVLLTHLGTSYSSTGMTSSRYRVERG